MGVVGWGGRTPWVGLESGGLGYLIPTWQAHCTSQTHLATGGIEGGTSPTWTHTSPMTPCIHGCGGVGGAHSLGGVGEWWTWLFDTNLASTLHKSNTLGHRGD